MGWEAATEVEIGSGRTRGWIDILAYHEGSRTLLVIEVKTELHDTGALLRTISWCEGSAWAAACARGWRPRRLASAALFLATAANDTALRENADLLAPEFPVGARDFGAFLRNASGGLPAGRRIAMIDPLSRRQTWLRRTRLDGRRLPAPHAEYAVVARRILGGRGSTARTRSR